MRKIVLLTEKTFVNSRLKVKNFQNIEITKTIYLNSERSEQFLGQNHDYFLIRNETDNLSLAP